MGHGEFCGSGGASLTTLLLLASSTCWGPRLSFKLQLFNDEICSTSMLMAALLVMLMLLVLVVVVVADFAVVDIGIRIDGIVSNESMSVHGRADGQTGQNMDGHGVGSYVRMSVRLFMCYWPYVARRCCCCACLCSVNEERGALSS